MAAIYKFKHVKVKGTNFPNHCQSTKGNKIYLTVSIHYLCSILFQATSHAFVYLKWLHQLSWMEYPAWQLIKIWTIIISPIFFSQRRPILLTIFRTRSTFLTHLIKCIIILEVSRKGEKGASVYESKRRITKKLQ